MKLGILKFGRELLETEDLDPIYVMLHKANLDKKLLRRWLVGYFWFYHAGVASHLAGFEGRSFYDEALRLAMTKGTPRGTERRHFRGEACIKCIKWFRKTYDDPEDAISHLLLSSKRAGKRTLKSVTEFVKETWPLFGPWIAFKIADMTERVLGFPVHFSEKDLELYSTPTEGARVYCRKKDLDFEKLGVVGVTERLGRKFKDFKAPPRYDRPVNVQEVETILCKWHSHLHGHYPLGKDTREIYHGLKGWGKLAKKLRRHLP